MSDDALLQVALAAAEARDPASVLRTVVDGLTQNVGLALARVWLVGPGGPCEACPMREECPDRTRCLHLVASAGNPQHEPRERWTRTDGDFRRFPLGVRKVGHIAARGESLLVADIEHDAAWIARPEWARAEGIRSFAGHPLVFRGEVLGVLAVFCRAGIGPERFAQLRGFAAQAAVAIANARAFDELARLREQLELERDYLREEVRAARAHGAIVGSSPALRAALEQIELVAPTDANVLVLGESGTGKELVAQAIHERSARAAAPLVRVNCAAVPRELFESEFFGHARGAFTGAVRDRAGRFELAQGGTLFLDEVGEIPLELQGKLLRVLQEGTFERVGEDRTRRANVRVVAATNRDLRRQVDAGRFREDLYYRLAVFPIELPPLRERPGDVGALAAHFLALNERKLGKKGLRLTNRDVQALERYAWPGNVRELASVIERATILARDGRLTIDAVLARANTTAPATAHAARATMARGPSPAIETESDRKQRERANIQAALAACGGKIYGPGGAAELLSMRPTTLASRIQALGIRRRP
ncbi:MAG: sigma 54-interacting transcriptional regulator [Deltaproteobacteria bacterium]|nr:sigma 54-interacting transcriptional regulator [Deltaproteobacteria bacterium]